jgi:hypothetical protein
MKLGKSLSLLIPAVAAGAATMLIAPGSEAGAVQGRAARGSLCAADEVAIYQCGIGRQLVAVCGSRTGTPHAQYRFGTPGHVALAFPGPGTSGGLTYAREIYSGGGALQIRFANEGHDYAVYSRTVRTGFGSDGRNNPQFSDGIMVRRGGRLISNRSCTTEVGGNAQPEDYMPEGTIMEFPD